MLKGNLNVEGGFSNLPILLKFSSEYIEKKTQWGETQIV